MKKQESFWRILIGEPSGVMLSLLILGQVVIASWALSVGVSLQLVSLITQACHLTLSSLALIFSLFALLISKKTPNLFFNFGYSRMETLSAFTNCTYFYFITLFAIFQNFHSFFEDHLHTNKQDQNDYFTYICMLISFLGMLYFMKYHKFDKITEISQIFVQKHKTYEQNLRLFDKMIEMNYQTMRQYEYQTDNNLNYERQFEQQQANYYKNKQYNSHQENMFTIFLHFQLSFMINFANHFSLEFLDRNNQYKQNLFGLSTGILFFIIIFAQSKEIFILTSNILLSAIPINDEQGIQKIFSNLKEQNEGIKEIQSYNLWAMNSGYYVLNMKIELHQSCEQQEMLLKIQDFLKDKFQEVCIELLKKEETL